MLANSHLVGNFLSSVFSVAAWDEELVDPWLVHLILVTDAILCFAILQNHCQGMQLHPTSIGICGVESFYAEWLILCSFSQRNIVVLCILTLFWSAIVRVLKSALITSLTVYIQGVLVLVHIDVGQDGILRELLLPLHLLVSGCHLVPGEHTAENWDGGEDV